MEQPADEVHRVKFRKVARTRAAVHSAAPPPTSWYMDQIMTWRLSQTLWLKDFYGTVIAQA